MKIAARSGILLFLFAVAAFVVFPKNTFASLSSCTVDLHDDSTSININETKVFNFDVTNNDDNNGRGEWVSFSAPTGLTIQGDSTFTQYDMGSGVTTVISVTAAAGGNAGSGSWIVQMSDDSGGSGAIPCGGNQSVTIVDNSASLPPQFQSVNISNISDTTATISWTTNHDTTGELDYGLDGSYGSTQTDSNSSSSHSIALSSLTANTTYHYNIKATNDNGTTELGDHTFTTAASPMVTVAQQTVTVTTTTTNTVTKTVTPTPTPTPPPDVTPPTINITTDFSKPFLQTQQISGTATDNKAVAKMDYSLDGGRNWLPVDTVTDLGKPSTAFSFLPVSLDDGNYALQVRATDSSNNVGTSKIYTLIIDRLPPQASGVLFSLGPQIIDPRIDGSIVTIAGQSLKVTLSEVGGSTMAAVIAINLSGGWQKTFSLTKDTDNGLWSGLLSLKEGNYQLSFSAIDGAGNKTNRNLNKIIAVAKGQISGPIGGATDAKITVYYLEPTADSWEVWDGDAYSQSNPQTADENGNYGLFLPPGKYYLHITAFGFKDTDTEFFNVNQAQPINANFTLKPLKLLFSLGFIKIYLPDFSVLSAPFKNNVAVLTESNSFIGRAVPFFNLSVAGQNALSSDSLTGKPSVLTFLNTWSPSSTEQVSVLDKFAKNKDFNTAVITEGEKTSKAYVFEKRGNYSLSVFADPDAALAVSYDLNSLPVHYFLDRKGVVKDVIYGALSEEELANTLINISQ